MNRIESFSFVPPDLVGVIDDHLAEFDGVVDVASADSQVHQAVVTHLAGRMVESGMTAAALMNASLREETDSPPHFVVQVLHADDIFYVDPVWEVVAQRLLPEERTTGMDVMPDPALCFRTHELPAVVSWFGNVAEIMAIPRDTAEQWAATTWDPTSYRPIPVPKEPGLTYQL